MDRLLSRPANHLRHIRRPSFPDQLLHLIWRRHQILDPNGDVVTLWNHVFLLTCILALFIDPLYFYLPYVGGPACMSIDVGLGVAITFFRTLADFCFLFHMIMKFRTAFVAPSSRVFGRGELVMDPHQIAMRYLKSTFIIDLAAALPLPQIVNWIIIPATRNNRADYANNTVALIVLLQYIPRVFVMFPLNQRIIKTTGVIAKTAWLGAAYNLLLFMLASHVLGASWYLLSIGRQHSCWRQECRNERNAKPSCVINYLDCASLNNPMRNKWLNVTRVLAHCDAKKDDTDFKFGMFAAAFTSEVASSRFIEKYLYCLWWGLRNLSILSSRAFKNGLPALLFQGTKVKSIYAHWLTSLWVSLILQGFDVNPMFYRRAFGLRVISAFEMNLDTSTYIGETSFCIIICIGGLVLFAQLIGQMQTYLASITVRLEEWRIKRRDTEEWMRHRQLPVELQERVRRFVQYKWIATRGVDEESILQSLPVDLRREIRRHLCLQLVRRVPFFSQMDDQLLDAICERLVSSLSTKDTYIVREDDPVNEMLFIIRGQLESSTTNGGRTGFFNSITLRPGDFCGEELLTWALMPNSSLNLPSSTRTVRTLTEVEAFALQAEDLKFVSHQFKRLHSKKLQHAFRYYSHQWRTWGSCFIQAAWRRFKKKRLARELALRESFYYMRISDQESNCGDEQASENYDDSSRDNSLMDKENNVQNLGVTMLASKFAANTRRGMTQKVQVVDPDSSLKLPKLFKPDEPDFSAIRDV